MVCCTPPAHTRVGSIPDFSWSEVKLPIWLPALLSHITCAANVGMAHARPFSTSKLQELFNSIKNTWRPGVLAPVIKFRVFGSSWRLSSPRFGSVNVILTFLQSEVATVSLMSFIFQSMLSRTGTFMAQMFYLCTISTRWCILFNCSTRSSTRLHNKISGVWHRSRDHFPSFHYERLGCRII
jgi:hypothetical protein